MIRKIRNFIQRGIRGWANEDTWDFDICLAEIISEGITYLKKYQHGIPIDLAEKYDDETALIKRDERLDKMIRAFKLHLIWVNEGRILTEIEKKEYQEGLELFIKYMGNLWD